MPSDSYDREEMERGAPDNNPGSGPYSGENKPIFIMIPVSKILNWWKKKEKGNAVPD